MTGTRDGFRISETSEEKGGEILSVLISRTVGSQTAGADGDIVNRMMLLSFDVPFFGLGVFYADGMATQRTGVKIRPHHTSDCQGYPCRTRRGIGGCVADGERAVAIAALVRIFVSPERGAARCSEGNCSVPGRGSRQEATVSRASVCWVWVGDCALRSAGGHAVGCAGCLWRTCEGRWQQSVFSCVMCFESYVNLSVSPDIRKQAGFFTKKNRVKNRMDGNI